MDFAHKHLLIAKKVFDYNAIIYSFSNQTIKYLKFVEDIIKYKKQSSIISKLKIFYQHQFKTVILAVNELLVWNLFNILKDKLIINNTMANTHNLFQEFNTDLQITKSKKNRLKNSKDDLRKKIRKYFEENHPNYSPKFYTQGSFKMGSIIRTKDDTCDIDDGVYFENNQNNDSCTTLQSWVKNAVDGTTDDIKHCKKCITVNYKSDYNIDLPVYLFNENKDKHPFIAIKNEDWSEDDPKEMVNAFKKNKDSKGQLIKIIRYLKAWCDYKREKMPSGLAMTILAMNNYQPNDRDDIALKFTLIEIEKALKYQFKCIVPAIPNDDIFEDYETKRKDNFLNNLSFFIVDAKKAVNDEENQLKASRLWKKNLGDRFPLGKDEDENEAEANSIRPVIGSSRPYYD